MSEEQKNSSEPPEIFALEQGKPGWQFSRRAFLAASGAAAAALAAAGCNPNGKSDSGSGVKCARDEGIRAHETEVFRLVVSPDSSLLVTTADEDRTVKFWSLPEGELLVKLNTGQGFNPSVAFSPDGKLLVTHTSYDGKIKLWSMPKVELFKELSGHYSGVSDLRISPDGSRLISIDLHNVVRVWSLPGGKLLQTLDNFPGTVQKIALSSDAARLAIMIEDDKSVHLWSIPDDKSLATLDGKWSMTFSPDGALLAMPVDTKVHLYSAVDGVLINTLEGHDDSITRCSFTPDGSLLITGSFGGGGAAKEDHHSTIKFWSMPDGKLKKTLKSKKEKDTILSASPDGEWLATEYFKTPNTFTRFWSLPNGRRKKDFQLGESGCLTFSPDGSLLIQGQKELIRLYSWPDGILLNCLLDLESMSADSEGIEYEADDEKGGTITRHLPCGSALPPGAVCTCNCVSGGGCSCVGHSSGGSSHYWHPN